MTSRPLMAWLLLALALFVATATAATAAEPRFADTIWHGGPIVTVDDARPSADAVAVRDGRIVGVGSLAELRQRFEGPSTRLMDLRGRTLLPGFIDAHGHITGVGFQAMVANALPPPDGRNDSVAALQRTLREWMAANPWHRTLGVVFGFGYDDSQLAERRAPTREELDAVSADLPVVVIHQSGHLGAYNSVALRRAGIDAATPDPAGGVIQRKRGSREPSGVLEETAHMGALIRLLPAMGEEQQLAMLRAGQELYLRFGHTTAQDGRTIPSDLKMLPRAAARGALLIDVVAYPDLLLSGDDPALRGPLHARTYTDGLRIGGVKLNLDGSPQGRTAWLTQPYHRPPPGQPADYAGYPSMKPAEANAQVLRAFREGWQVLVHTNGDAAIDQFLDAVEAAHRMLPVADRRPVMIHGQTLRRDQVDRLRALGVFPSLFPMHTFYWGDWHRDTVLGPQRAQNISPTGWLTQLGMRFTTHHDAPVALPDTLRVLSATVNRTTRSGAVLGPEHRVEPLVAIKAMTLWAAYQHFEEDSKGSIEVGKLADFAVLSGNPLTVPRERLIDLRVEQTIKRGRMVWERHSANADAGCAADAACATGLARLQRRVALYEAFAPRR